VRFSRSAMSSWADLIPSSSMLSPGRLAGLGSIHALDQVGDATNLSELALPFKFGGDPQVSGGRCYPDATPARRDPRYLKLRIIQVCHERKGGLV